MKPKCIGYFKTDHFGDFKSTCIFKIAQNEYLVQRFNTSYTVDLRYENRYAKYYIELVKTALNYKGTTFIEKCNNRYEIPPNHEIMVEIPTLYYKSIRENLEVIRYNFIHNQLSDVTSEWLNEKEWAEWLKAETNRIYKYYVG